jgi:pSer/pThr/pTyr-binding forkhead associated (FHA) protein
MKLELIRVDPQKPPIMLDQFPVIVGLDPGADVCLDDSTVGHYQCMIDHSDGELMVWDLGTKSGTLVNGVRVSPKAPLRSGDELSFGKHRFVARYQDGVARPSPREKGSGSSGANRAVPPRRRRQPAAQV